MFGFDINTYRTFAANIRCVQEEQYLFKSWNQEFPVILRVTSSQVWQTFLGAQHPDFRKSEVLGKPADFFLTVDYFSCFPISELFEICNIGGAR